VHPTVAVLDKEHRLVQFQPYSKLNFCESVLVRIRHVLGEVDDKGLARGLDPAADQEKGNTAAARRDLKLAELLLKGGNLDKALEVAKKGVSNDPKSAAAQALLGQIHAAKGDCAEANRAFEAALKLDPSEARAKTGQSTCAGKK
jgi:tetratricopeptide (TPR) repeat protein